MKQFSPEVEWRDISSVIPYTLNAKRHPESQISKIAASIAEFGFDQPIVVDSDGVIVKGHGRREGALKLGLTQVPVIVRTDLTPTQVRAARIADNKVAESDYDLDSLVIELQRLDEENFDLSLTGFDQDELDAMFADADAESDLQPADGEAKGNLADRFGIPPFTVMSAREGWWQDRKRAWIAMGIKSELGRGAAPGGGSDAAGSFGGGKRNARGIDDASN